MALDPAMELRELDAILGSTDDPQTKQARIAQLYAPVEAANDPSGGLPPEATAFDPMGAVRQQRDADIQQQTATDAAKPLPGLIPYDPTELERQMQANTETPPGMVRVEPGKGQGYGTLAENLGLVSVARDPTEAAPPVRPAPARVTAIPETTVPGVARKHGAGRAPTPGTPEWLARSMAAEGLDTGNAFPKEPIGRPVSHREDSAYRALEGEMLDQTRAQGEAEAQAIQAGARAEVAAVERGELVDAELARREMDRQRLLEGMERDYGEMLAEADAEPIDSERLWNNKSTGEKILSKIALFIGTIGGAGLGDPKLMMAKMDGDVERDLAAQKANKAFSLHKLAAKGTLYGMARDRFGSEQAVDQAMRETAWRKIDAQLKNFHAVAQDPARKAAIEQLMAQTEGKILDSERQRRILNEADTLARMRAAAAANATRGAASRKNIEDPRYVPGLGFARTVKEAQDMRQAQADYASGKRQFARARGFAADFSSKMGSTTLETGSKEFHEADALSQSLKNQVAKSFGGVITEGDRQAAAKEVPQLTRMWGGLDERLRMAEERYDRNFRSAIESTIIGAPVAPIPQQEGDAPAVPLPQGQMERPMEKPVRTR